MKKLQQPLQNSIVKFIDYFETDKPILICNHVENLSIAKALKSEQISTIKKDNGPERIEMLIVKVLREVMILIPNEFSTDGLIYFAKMFVQSYWHWKIDDLVLCLRYGTLGKYGTIYGNLSFPMVMQWLQKYQIEKDDMIENTLLDDYSQNCTRDYSKEQSQSLLEAYHNNKPNK